MDTKTARIRALNDELRQNFAEGIAVMTPGIAALGGVEFAFCQRQDRARAIHARPHGDARPLRAARRTMVC
jgi:hypothetical protein